MRKTLKEAITPELPVLLKGQVWRVDDQLMKIGQVGRHLVHHRTLHPELKRVSRETLTTIKAFQEFLTTKEGVLVPETGAGYQTGVL